MKVLRELEAACKEENDELMKMCSPSVVTVLKAIGVKNVVFMREVAFACGSRDIASPALMLIGLSMIGWAPPADGLMERMRKPEASVEDFLAGREARNAKILKAMKSSGDTELDTEAYKKTLEERERGVLCGPYASMEELPFTDVALVPRHGIWEQHGGAVERSCRNIDDMLVEEQNSTVGTVSSHRPTDPDGLVSQTRAIRCRFPKAPLVGWPCDLEKAYKQVPGNPKQLQWIIIVVWDPAEGKPVFFVAFCQLFGGKSPPLNFARYAAWIVEAAAVLFGLPATHCVDDIIGIEPVDRATSGNMAFKAFCSLAGWKISAGKSPMPSNRFVVIGVALDLSPVPNDDAILKVSEARVEQLEKILLEIKAKRRLGSGEAASLTGKLGFSLCASFGRFGRAKLRPFIRRSNEHRSGWNQQLDAACDFWLALFGCYVPRRIPMQLESLESVVSYSDGEGAKAGLGIAIWSSRC